MSERFTYEVTDTGKYYYDNGVRIFPKNFWQIIHDLNNENEQLKEQQELLISECRLQNKQKHNLINGLKGCGLRMVDIKKIMNGEKLE